MEYQENEKTIRYKQASNILELVQLMLGQSNGVTLDEICDKFGCTRRTAERMRDAILNVFENVDVVTTEGKTKRWGFTDYRFQQLVEFNDNEIKLMEILKYSMNGAYSNEMKVIISKMKTLKKKKSKKN